MHQNGAWRFTGTARLRATKCRKSIEDPAAEPEYPQFADGLRQLTILEAGSPSAPSMGMEIRAKLAPNNRIRVSSEPR
jgi:hypothetical protein